MKKTFILTRERSEEEKLRRLLHGDKGGEILEGESPEARLPTCHWDDNHNGHERPFDCRTI